MTPQFYVHPYLHVTSVSLWVQAEYEEPSAYQIERIKEEEVSLMYLDGRAVQWYNLRLRHLPVQSNGREGLIFRSSDRLSQKQIRLRVTSYEHAYVRV